MSDQLQSLQVTFRHMPPSTPLRELAEQKFMKFKNQFADAVSCHVVIDCPAQNHHNKGNHFHVQVELNVGRTHTRIAAEADHEDAYAAVRDAFERAKKQAESRLERQAV